MIPEDAAAITCGAIPVEQLRSHLPTFCELIVGDEDPSMAVAVDFWPAKLNEYLLGDSCLPGDELIDLGDLFGREAIWFIRNQRGARLLVLILNAMGKRLHEERRCPGPLERGFLDRVKADCPNEVDAVVMWHFRQHPEQMN
jgi:hypothetical protein